MTYLLLKYIHIISATILFGTGIGSAFYMFVANRKKELAGICFALENVVIADFIFTTPSVIIQLLSGVALVYYGGYDFSENWVKWGLILYFFAGFCWVPVIFIQIKMRNIARIAFRKKTQLPKEYWKLDKWWIVLGSAAFPAVMIVFYLMVFKPS